MTPSTGGDQAHEDDPGAEPVPGTARAVREVDVLPDGRRVTWYASAGESVVEGEDRG